MIDLQILQNRGLTAENLEKWLAGDPTRDWGTATPEKPSLTSDPTDKNTPEWEKRRALHYRIRSRVQEGMNRNFADYRTFHALDVAWDRPFHQVSQTLLAQFMDSDLSNDQVKDQLNKWGLTELVTQEKDPKSGQPTGKSVFNIPMFFNVFVPLVKSYVTIRWAKIVNDRNQTPFLKYEPVKLTSLLKVKCEAITDRIQIMSSQYGHFDVMKQAVLKMLHYSFCLLFPREEWHSESQWKNATKMDVKLGKKKNDGKDVVSEGDEIKVTTREGIRHHGPHPSRTFRDLAHGAWTYNYDCGCSYGGYWRISRYRDVLAEGFWNKDRISLGNADIMGANQLFFSSVYAACQMKYGCLPTTKVPDGSVAAAETGSPTGELDREKALANQWYNNDYLDQGVLITEYFEKLIPKDNGLGDYDCPVWFRFVLAGDGCTILYAAPLPYCPVIYFGYDADESRSKNASLSLEILPFQDQFSNVLTQILHTARQNLANITFVDEDQLTTEEVSILKNIGNRFYAGLNIFGISRKKAARMQNRVADAIESHGLPKGNVAELTNVLKTILDVLERVLVMSSHEVAQAASHEQTREEVKNIAQSTSSRLAFTSKAVDIGLDAMKRQLYQGVMAYGDDDIYTHIPSETMLTQEQLAAMGFTYVDKDTEIYGKDRYRMAKTTKAATAVDLWTFASNRDSQDRSSDRELAVAMATFARDLMSNPITAEAIGTDQAVAMANEIAQLAGFRRDFKLRNMAPNTSPEQQKAEAQAQLKQVVDTVLGIVNQELKTNLEPLVAETKRNSQEIALLMRVATQAGNPSHDIPQPEPALVGQS